jgi:hypothetical protein
MTKARADTWARVREVGLDLSDALSLARGPARIEAAALAVRDARLALESITGLEAEAARAVLCALEAAHRGPA